MAFEASVAEEGPLPLGGHRRGGGTRNARRPSKASPAGGAGVGVSVSGWSGGSSSSSFPSSASASKTVHKLADVGGPLRHMMFKGVESMVHAFERDW